MPSPRVVCDNSPRWIREYYPAFNGLRASAIVLVFCRHYLTLVSPAKIFWGAWVGVDLFFVISGFLITGILYDSLGQPRYFSTFYIRRSLRIFPLFYGVFLVLGVLKAFCWLLFSEALWSYALYVGNIVAPYLAAHHYVPSIITLPSHPGWSLRVDHLWSLCVEEQFYLIWPFVVYKIQSRTALLRVCATFIVLTPILRCAIFASASPLFLAYGHLYYATYSRFDTLLMGAFLAIWLRGAKPTKKQLRQYSYALAVSTASILAIGVALTIRKWPYSGSNPFLATVGFSLIGLFMVSIVLRSLDEESLLARMMAHSALVYLGTISYGFYVFHDIYRPIVTHVLRQHIASSLGEYSLLLGVFALTTLFATISFRFYEAPFLRLKRLWAPAAHSGLTSSREVSGTS